MTIKESIENTIDDAGKSISDAFITTKVKAEILADPLLKVFQISVTTTNKIVTLSGTVDNLLSAQRSLEIVKSNKDVLSVKNNLLIKNESNKAQPRNPITDNAEKIGEYVSDAYITTKIKAGILSDPLLKVFQISVSTNDGAVQLSGEVDAQQDILRAQDIASNIMHVKSVKNELVVKAKV